MGSEIERKFLVDPARLAGPDGPALGPGARLRQGYLALDGEVELRLRLTDGTATLTVKAGTGLARTEVEAEVPAPEAEALWPSTAGRRIEKVRHRVPLGDVVAEVDRYEGALAGLLTVEVEFTSADRAARFEPPTWFGRELTGVPGWSNAALARHGRPA